MSETLTYSQISERLKTHFATRKTYDADYRIYNLKHLGYLIEDNRDAIKEALRRDLDKGGDMVDLEEVRWSYVSDGMAMG